MLKNIRDQKKAPYFPRKKLIVKTQLIKQQIFFDKDNIGLFYRQ
jgi:hypothetical protein